MVYGNILGSPTFSLLLFFLKDVVVLAVIARLGIKSDKEKNNRYSQLKNSEEFARIL